MSQTEGLNNILNVTREHVVIEKTSPDCLESMMTHILWQLAHDEDVCWSISRASSIIVM